ncbi:SDR family NAD(P)-dependent oxidoreductase, partial [Kitasatospora indigofera]|uniref:SDR family NAD(P)-dependent oxidoreductase n=1 Tax=Kitasatospora indigofera TaxID=67307 RepID=UPI0036C444DB
MSAGARWNPSAIPSQAGKTIVVTGANAGLGFFAGQQLAGAGAHVVLACRNPGRADAAALAIRARVPGASVSTLTLDVASLDSVRAASAELLRLGRIDGLVLNAGIVHPPRRRELSSDGLELVLATNYLGHFALTAQLLPALLATPGSRVVTLGSMISRLMDSSLEDLQLAGGYQPWRAYAQSKIAAQVFGFELDRRLRAASAAAEASRGA